MIVLFYLLMKARVRHRPEDCRICAETNLEVEPGGEP